MKNKTLKILYSSRDEDIRESLKHNITSKGHIATECNSFLDVILYCNDKYDLFICDISYHEQYFEVYLKLREDKRYFIPNTVFITNNQLNGVCCLSKKQVLLNDFCLKEFTNLDSMLNFCLNDSAFKNALKYYGLSYRYEGTILLEEVLKITYMKPFPYLKKIGLCYDYLSEKYNISVNAIKKKMQRAICYANMMNGKAIKELCYKYEIECPTVKLLISHILSELSYLDF